MSVIAFEGPAGCGKTHNLMAELCSQVAAGGLPDGHRVLALTFFHGSRLRLDALLSKMDLLRGRYQACTIDSFAWRVCSRWRSLLRELGKTLPSEDAYDQTCDLAALLLSRSGVRAWVAQSFPLIVVDEAQDLKPERSRIIEHLAKDTRMLLAYDEFQCLDENLRPIPLEGWLLAACEPRRLQRNERTNVAELLKAGESLRAGKGIDSNGKILKVMVAGPRSGFPPTLAAVQLYWAARKSGSVALLTPSQKGFPTEIVQLARAGFTTKKGEQYAPVHIDWDQSDRDALKNIASIYAHPTGAETDEILAGLSKIVESHTLQCIEKWLAKRRRIAGHATASEAEVIAQIKEVISRRRRYGHRHSARLRAMTIHQAKNQEFEHVVIVWTFAAIRGSADQRRRLLYNAITRAKKSCTILVQSQQLLKQAPFV